MKFAAYLACIPPNNKNVEKGEILKLYATGVQKYGDEVELVTDMRVVPADVGMSIGWVHAGSKGTAHLEFRRKIIDYQLNANKKVLLADSNLFLYKDNTNPKHYLRYSFNGIFPNTGEYCDKEIDPQRWITLSKNLNLSLKDYRTTGNHILFCLQRNGGWSMGGYDVVEWTAATLKEIRKYTDREIVLRAHPGDKGSKDYLSPQNLIKKLGHKNNNIRLSQPGTTLEHDLKNCWAVVNYNSSPTVGAAIEGYPIFVTDPEKSQCAEISNMNLSDIENPNLPDRQKWVERLAMFHWNFEEITNGECWSHMRKYV